MDQDLTYDVAVLGAGPAGTCAALRGLKLGYRVLILEAEGFPRPQIGESLSPGVWNIFKFLEAETLLQVPEYLQGLPARVIWESEEVHEISAEQRGAGVVVDRGRLDADLLELCRQRGAMVVQPAKVEAVVNEGGEWLVRVNLTEGKRVFSAKFVLDARGRKGVPNAQRLPLAPLSVGLWSEVSSSQAPAATLIEARPGGWLWGSPLPNGNFRVMAFCDASQSSSLSSPDQLQAYFRSSQLFSWIPEQWETPLMTRTVQPFWNVSSVQDRYFHLGDAAFFLDPLSSSGVEKAMRFSLQMVTAMHTALQYGEPDLAEEYYRHKILQTVAVHCNWTTDFYGKAWAKGEEFWQTRSSRFRSPGWEGRPEVQQLELVLVDQESKMKSAEKLADIPPSGKGLPLNGKHPLTETEIVERIRQQPIKISDQVQFQEEICVVTDHLERREALCHPGLERPIAFMGPVEVVPLLRSMRSPVWGDDLLRNWSSVWGKALAVKIILKLYRTGVLEEFVP